MLIVSNTIFAHLHSLLQSIKNECSWKFKICIFNKYSNSNAKKIGKSHDWKMATANIEVMFGMYRDYHFQIINSPDDSLDY